MKKRITFELDVNDPLYLFLVKYSKDQFMTITGVIKLALQKLLNEKNQEA